MRATGVAAGNGAFVEPLVAKIFERKTGYRVYQIRRCSSTHSILWMLADVDYFVELPDGTTAILEIKTTNYNARDNWWMNGKETVPVYYESQGRHYMAVTDLDRCFFAACMVTTRRKLLSGRSSVISSMRLRWSFGAVFLENHVQRHAAALYRKWGLDY